MVAAGSCTEELLRSGQLIVASMKNMGMADAATLAVEDLPANVWVRHPCNQGGFYASTWDASVKTWTYIMDLGFSAPAMQIAALVRYFDLGHLAGSLQHFCVLNDTPSKLEVEYVSALPWPFEPRWVCAEMEFGLGTSSDVFILGRSCPPGPQHTAHKRQGTTKGDVNYSYYHIRPTSASTCRLRRVICVDMHLPTLCKLILRKSLAAHYQDDTASMHKDLAALKGSEIEARMQGSEFFRALEAGCVWPTPNAQADAAGP